MRSWFANAFVFSGCLVASAAVEPIQTRRTAPYVDPMSGNVYILDKTGGSSKLSRHHEDASRENLAGHHVDAISGNVYVLDPAFRLQRLPGQVTSGVINPAVPLTAGAMSLASAASAAWLISRKAAGVQTDSSESELVPDAARVLERTHVSAYFVAMELSFGIVTMFLVARLGIGLRGRRRRAAVSARGLAISVASTIVDLDVEQACGSDDACPSTSSVSTSSVSMSSAPSTPRDLDHDVQAACQFHRMQSEGSESRTSDDSDLEDISARSQNVVMHRMFTAESVREEAHQKTSSSVPQVPPFDVNTPRPQRQFVLAPPSYAWSLNQWYQDREAIHTPRSQWFNTPWK